jgi:glutaredoxin
MLFNFRGQSKQQSDPGRLQIVIYTRQGCHLCDDAYQRLELYRQRYGFTVETVDVDSDPQLQASYGEHVPVVTVNGKVRFRGCVNPVLLKRLLQAETHADQRGR